MHSTRRFFFTILATLLTLTLSSNTSYGSSGSGWIPTTPLDDDPTFHSVTFQDFLPLEFNYSVLRSSNQQGQFVCSSTSDANCASNSMFQYNSILKVCQNSSDSDCIDSINTIDNSGKTTPATFLRYTVTNHLNAYPADSTTKIPAGDVPSIWNIPSAPHASGSEYAVVAGENGEVDKNGLESKTGRYLQVSLIPVKLKDFGKGKQSQAGGWENKVIPGVYYDFCRTSLRSGQNFTDCGHVNDDDCLLPTNEQGMCYAEEDFNGEPVFNVSLKLSKEPNGWIHGRITDPNISITKESSGNIKLSVVAGPTSVPLVRQSGLWSTLPDNLKQFWVDCFNNTLCGNWIYRGQNPTSDIIGLNQTLEGQAKINSNVYPYAFGKRALAGMAAIAPLIGDKSNAFHKAWSFRTLTNQEMNGSDSCFTKTPGIKGIVSTNSTTYSAGPPVLTDGSLQYQVASPHYMPDGKTPFKGFYHLVMSTETARCIYGFSAAPISASIQVVSADGTTDVATTSTAEKNGWLYLSATGFTFSAPTIKVKLEQQSSAPVVSAPIAVNTKKITITCVKGKTTKKISGTNPKCPTGYTKRK